MHPVLRNVLAVIGGLVIGSIVNMGIITLSGTIIPPPAGADVTTTEGLKAALPLFEPKHFLMPWLAHALGTLTGAFVATKIGNPSRIWLGLVIGVFFLMGGISMVFMVPSPTWFTITDLALAYLPMGYLGSKLAGA
ncbi:MAG: hypothetical protein MUE71_11630 [Chitinophagaceae bacterium]|nr:hypothetical protein [Chitinophagaceae bacterium]